MPVIKLVYGLHKPRYVSDEAVIRYYNRLGMQDEIYRLKDYSDGNHNKYQYLGNSFPEVLIFNSNGQLTKFEIDCSGSLDSIVTLSIHDIDNIHISPEGKSIQDFIHDTYVVGTLMNEDLSLLNIPLYVVKFAEYAGQLNKDNVPDLVERLKVRNDVRYIILNMDYTSSKKF